jgi:hypothetical protein
MTGIIAATTKGIEVRNTADPLGAKEKYRKTTPERLPEITRDECAAGVD